MDSKLFSCDSCTFLNSFSSKKCEICGSDMKIVKEPIKIDPLLIGNILKSMNTKNKIEKNYEEAYKVIPESFFQVDMLHFKCSINGYSLEAFVDTGAQMSIMSEECVNKCNLNDLIDYRYKGEARGVGTQTILGKIWLQDIDIEQGRSIPCGFTILKDMHIDMIFGLDMLSSHRATINLDKRVIEIGNISIPLIKKTK